MNILLVEDNPHDIFFVQRALKIMEKPVELNVVGDGEDALNFLYHREPYTQAAQPDLILLDLTMPRKTGMEVLTEIEQDLTSSASRSLYSRVAIIPRDRLLL